MGVVGGGVAGLVAAWALRRAGRSVVLLEAGASAGGHTLTAELPGGLPAADVGFQVFNLTNYPHFAELLRELGVESEPSDMTFSLSLGGGRWSGAPAGGSRASWRSPATPSGPGSGGCCWTCSASSAWRPRFSSRATPSGMRV